MLNPRFRCRQAAAFTLLELVAVLVVLAVLSAVALPKLLNYSANAKNSSDNASLAGINTALNTRYLQNRSTDAASSSWITSASQVAAVMEIGALPQGITLSGSTFTDLRGNTYTFTAETASSPARIAVATTSGGTSGSGTGSTPASGSGSDGSATGGTTGGTADLPPIALVAAAVPWMHRPRRHRSAMITSGARP